MGKTSSDWRLTILFCFLSLSVWAQEPAPLSAADTAKQKNEPIPLPKLAEAFGNTTLYLRSELYPVLRNPIVTEIAPSVDSLRGDVQAITGISAYVWDQQVATRISSGLANKWRGLYRQSTGYERDLANYSDQLENIRDELKRQQIIWTLTQASLPKDIPNAINFRIDTLQQELQRADSLLTGRFNELLSLQNRVLDIKLMGQYHMDNMERLEQLELQSLLSNRREPLPNLSWRGKPATAAENYRKVALDYFRTELSEFLRNNRERMILHLLIFIGLGLFFFLANSFFKKENNGNQDNEFNLASEVILSQPLTTAFLISLLLSSLLYPNRPAIFSDLIVMGLVVPFIVVIPRFVIRSNRWSIYLVGGLFFLHLMLKSAIINQVIFRWFMLVESLLLALFFFSVGLREKQWFRESKTSATFYRVMQLLSPICLVIASMAALGNLSGYDTLAEVFNLALERILLVGLIAFSAVLILDGLLRVGLNYRPVEPGTPRFIRRNNIFLAAGVVFRWSAVISWFIFALIFLRLFDPIRVVFEQFWLLGYSFGQLRLTVGSVLSFVLIIVVSWLLGKLLQILLEDEILPRFKLERGVPMAIGVIVRYGMLLLGILLALSNAGLDFQKLSILVGALAIGAGFGLQSFVANFVAGLSLIFERPISVGNIIIIDGVEGEVQEIGIRSSKIRTADGGLLIVPNVELINKQVINHSWTQQPRRFYLQIKAAKNANPQRVLDLLRQYAIREEGILTRPEPEPIFEGMQADGQYFGLFYWVNRNAEKAKSDLAANIQAGLKKEGLEN